MRILAPALAFAFSCGGAHAAPAALPDAGRAHERALEPDGGSSPPLGEAPNDPAALAAFAQERGTAAVPAIAGKLGSPDLALRSAAVAALGQIGGPQARAALQKQLDAETHPEIRAAIERAMAAASP